ncbi:MAG: penicillin acylase family protein [Candidatus Hydrogenedens sp.]|nr:penicillin acylase family protein [Candidatus Hydrogenedens sp.]
MTITGKIMRRFFSGLFLLFLLLLAAGLIHLYQIRKQSYRCLPDYNGTVTNCPVSASVSVIRDQWGVPHIEGATVEDAHFALGYCLAQDRLFQMECFRRFSQGRLSEILGPPAVKIDCLARLMGVGPLAAKVSTRSEAFFPPELLSLMNAFLDGVNHFIGEGNLPWEFQALRTGCEEFQLVDCLSVAGTIAFTFADGIRTDLMKSMIREAVPGYDVDLLFNGFEAFPVTIMDSPDETTAFQESRRESEACTAAGMKGLEQAAQWLSLVMSSPWQQVPPGSNSWVLSGEKTKSGNAILANDPHIVFTNPSIWYEAHVSGGDFESYGYYLPPLPVPLLGHNDFCGWALTMLANDDADIHELTLDPDDPDRYFYDGEWRTFTREKEHITVRFGKDRDCEFRSCELGVVCNDFFNLYMDYTGPPLAVRWSGKEEHCFADLCAFYEMALARDYESFETGVRKVRSYRLNVSYADREGSIAWWGTGHLPWYPPDVDPKCVIPAGRGEEIIADHLRTQDWLHLKNPPEGMIITANNRPTLKPVGQGEKAITGLAGYFKASDRAGRIREILEERNDWTVEELQAVQMDNKGYTMRSLLPLMIRLARKGASSFSALEEESLARLESWDFEHGADSLGAPLFHFWFDSIFQEVFQNKLPERLYTLYAACEDNWFALRQLLEDEGNLWWDCPDTEKEEEAPEMVARALRDACARLQKELGSDPSQWRWGRVHQVTYTHPFGYIPLLGRLVNIGPLESGGSNQTVNNMLSKKLHNYHVIAGPSTRRLIDFAHPEESFTILPTGNSGHLRSPHYADQAELFIRGDYRKAYMSRALVEEHGIHRMTLEPGP